MSASLSTLAWRLSNLGHAMTTGRPRRYLKRICNLGRRWNVSKNPWIQLKKGGGGYRVTPSQIELLDNSWTELDIEAYLEWKSGMVKGEQSAATRRSSSLKTGLEPWLRRSWMGQLAVLNKLFVPKRQGGGGVLTKFRLGYLVWIRASPNESKRPNTRASLANDMATTLLLLVLPHKQFSSLVHFFLDFKLLEMGLDGRLTVGVRLALFNYNGVLGAHLQTERLGWIWVWRRLNIVLPICLVTLHEYTIDPHPSPPVANTVTEDLADQTGLAFDNLNGSWKGEQTPATSSHAASAEHSLLIKHQRNNPCGCDWPSWHALTHLRNQKKGSKSLKIAFFAFISIMDLAIHECTTKAGKHEEEHRKISLAGSVLGTSVAFLVIKPHNVANDLR